MRARRRRARPCRAASKRSGAATGAAGAMPLTPPRRSPLTPPPRPPALRWRAVSPAGLQPQEGEAREEQAGGGRRRGNARGATRRGPPLQPEVVASIAIDSRCVEYGFTCVVQFGKYTALLFSLKNVLNSHLGPRSTAGPTVTATKRSIAHNARRGLASPPRALGVYKRDSAQEHGDHPGPCPRPESEIRRPRAQTGEKASARFGDVSVARRGGC